MVAFAEPLQSERLILRPYRLSDLDDVQAFQADPEVVRYLYWEVRTREQSQTWLDAMIAVDRLDNDNDGVTLAVERREDGTVIGSVNVWLRSKEHRQGEIGFVFVGSEQRKGYATEAMTALLDAVFPLLDLHRVYGSTDARNTASAALMRRLGMREEAHFRENEMFKGAWGDTLIFAILRAEWESR